LLASETTSKEEMAYRFYPMSQTKKVAPAPAKTKALDTGSMQAFPSLASGPGPGSGSSSSSSSGPKLDFKKMVLLAPVAVQAIHKVEAEKIKVKPSSSVVTHCYDEYGEDYDGPDEWEIDTHEFNAGLPVGGRRGGF